MSLMEWHMCYQTMMLETPASGSRAVKNGVGQRKKTSLRRIRYKVPSNRTRII